MLMCRRTVQEFTRRSRRPMVRLTLERVMRGSSPVERHRTIRSRRGCPRLRMNRLMERRMRVPRRHLCRLRPQGGATPRSMGPRRLRRQGVPCRRGSALRRQGIRRPLRRGGRTQPSARRLRAGRTHGVTRTRPLLQRRVVTRRVAVPADGAIVPDGIKAAVVRTRLLTRRRRAIPLRESLRGRPLLRHRTPVWRPPLHRAAHGVRTRAVTGRSSRAMHRTG